MAFIHLAFLTRPSFVVAGFIGMALSYGLSLNMSLVFSINNQCMLSNYIISVERLDQYMHIPSEAAEVVEESRPPTTWPSEGRVEIHDLKVAFLLPYLSALGLIPNSCIASRFDLNRSDIEQMHHLFYAASAARSREGIRSALLVELAVGKLPSSAPSSVWWSQREGGSWWMELISRPSAFMT